MSEDSTRRVFSNNDNRFTRRHPTNLNRQWHSFYPANNSVIPWRFQRRKLYFSQQNTRIFPNRNFRGRKRDTLSAYGGRAQYGSDSNKRKYRYYNKQYDRQARYNSFRRHPHIYENQNRYRSTMYE